MGFRDEYEKDFRSHYRSRIRIGTRLSQPVHWGKGLKHYCKSLVRDDHRRHLRLSIDSGLKTQGNQLSLSGYAFNILAFD